MEWSPVLLWGASSHPGKSRHQQPATPKHPKCVSSQRKGLLRYQQSLSDEENSLNFVCVLWLQSTD